MSKPTLSKQVEELTNRILILEKMVAHILYTEPRDDDDDEEYENPYSTDDKPFQFEGMLDDAWKIISDVGKVSTSYLQRRMSLGYNNCAKIMDELEKQGIIGEPDGVKPREILKKYPGK
jgi:DNA segregation ATPase FtsK/SpoIIIE, S-DNA-T family